MAGLASRFALWLWHGTRLCRTPSFILKLHGDRVGEEQYAGRREARGGLGNHGLLRQAFQAASRKRWSRSEKRGHERIGKVDKAASAEPSAGEQGEVAEEDKVPVSGVVAGSRVTLSAEKQHRSMRQIGCFPGQRRRVPHHRPSR